MLDIKEIEKNPEAFDQAMKNRGNEHRAKHLLVLYQQKKDLTIKIQNLQARRKQISERVAEAKRKGEGVDELMQESLSITQQIKELVEKTEKLSFDYILSTVPNILDEEVPIGKNDSENVEVLRWGGIPKFNFKVKQHFELGVDLGQMDFEQAAIMSGARFTNLYGGLAKLERALTNFFLAVGAKFGYTEASIPYLVKDGALFGTGQLPKFAEDAFRAGDNYWLIPTSEVPLTNLVNNKILEEKELPLRFTTCSPCFRSEAGAAGKDTRGMLRQHQFKKVELVSITTPEHSKAEHQRMLDIEEYLLQKLGLPYRKMLICSGDIGFTARRQYDMEVWLPGQNVYREITSCSNCGDFQARRMQARYHPADEKGTRFVHTLNGSALAIGRTIIAIMENYQQQDGSIAIPDVLVSYMDGVRVIDSSHKTLNKD